MMDEAPNTTAGSRRMTAAEASQAWLRALSLASAIDDRPERTFPDVIDALAVRFGDAPAVLSDRECLSFRALAERSNRYSRWALGQGLKPGQSVALLMTSRPDYLAAWIGLTRVGVVAALLNSNLMGGGLAHCIRAAQPVLAIVEDRLLDAWRSAGEATPVWVHGDRQEDSASGLALEPALAACEGARLPVHERPVVTTATRALLIYTSGTTGLPKAANVSHHRVMMWSHWFAGMIETTAADRMYDCLPLYHSVGGVVATGAALVNGGSVVIAEKFSARQFWDEVVRWDCTLIQYIGELCRYLLNAPTSASERAHRVRLACGNGLRPDVWAPFQDRFSIPRVLEFYAATEGNFALYNVEGKPGAIGRIPAFMAARFPVAIVRHDSVTEQPVRDERGFCQRCQRDEVGEAIGRLADGETARAGRFEGYTAADDTERKILRHVFADGDAWVRTGDLMRLDRQGYFYFADRIGDTFRWKGENVATTEVAAVVAGCPGVVETIVYGVAIPGADGRAGMAALVTAAGFDPAQLFAHVAERLPPYAWPVFLRLCAGFELTETFKQKKSGLVREGVDPALVREPVLILDRGRATYAPLNAETHARLAKGEVRL